MGLVLGLVCGATRLAQLPVVLFGNSGGLIDDMIVGLHQATGEARGVHMGECNIMG